MAEFKIEVNNNDVSTWTVADEGISTATVDSIGNGSIFIDKNVPFPITIFDEVKFSLKVDSFIHLWTGLITKVIDDSAKNRFRILVSSSAYRYLKKTATNKFRQDSGNGNAITIVKNLNDEYIPELSYDDNTLPVTDFEFVEQAYQNKHINEVFDYIADVLDRQWWTDKDNKINMKARAFPLVSSTVTVEDISGDLTVDTDPSKMANNVIVDGATLTKVKIQDIPSTSGSVEFDLDFIPLQSMRVTAGGTDIDVSIEGADGFDTDFDAYVKVADRKLTFGTTPIAPLQIFYDTVSAVHEEVQDGASIDSEGITIDKVIVNPNITTQQQAFDIANNYKKNYSVPLQIIRATVLINSQSQIEDFMIGNTVRVTKGSVDGDFKVVGVQYVFGTGGVRLNMTFTEFPETNADLLKQLILKVKQREEKERKSTTSLTKYFFWGGNIYVELMNANILEQDFDTGDASGFILGHPDKGELGVDKLGSPTQTGSIELRHVNSERGFMDTFLEDEFFKKSGSTTATFNSGTYQFSTSEVYNSNIIEKDDNIYSKGWYIFGLIGERSIDLSSDSDNNSDSTAVWDTTNERLVMDSSTVRSKVYNTFIEVNTAAFTTGLIKKATFKCDETKFFAGDVILYYLSVDQGNTWHNVSRNVEFTFETGGNNIGFKTVFIGSGAVGTFIDNIKIAIESEVL